MKLFVGIDVSSEKLDVCFLTDDNQLSILSEISVANDIEGASFIRETILEFCFPDHFDNHSSSFIQEKKLREKIDTIFSKNGERNQISQYLSQLIQHLLQTETKEQLLIHLQITKQFTGNYHLQSHLQQLFRKDAVKITAYSEHADLIITDQHEKISDETETFYLDTTHNTVLFGKLIKAVHELYMKKGYENKTKRM
ncbi:hypothetical protein EfmAA290_22520 [Enterococcus faecium]|nr:hypothetical protein EfmAA290_22520 [Enterococcus faecium]